MRVHQVKFVYQGHRVKVKVTEAKITCQYIINLCKLKQVNAGCIQCNNNNNNADNF